MEVIHAPNDMHLSTGKVLRTEGPTQDEWEARRSMITALYRQEKLVKVREIMRRDYGFEASERMYKTRVKHWGLDKKNKSNEMAHALRIIRRRKAERKNTVVVIREKVVGEAAVHRYFKRQKISEPRVASHKTDVARTPPAISYFTPPPSSSPISDPDAGGTVVSTNDSSIVRRRPHISRNDKHQSTFPHPGSKQLTIPVSTSRCCVTSHDLYDKASSKCNTNHRLTGQNQILALMDLLPSELIPLNSLNVPSWDESALVDIKDYYDTYFQSPRWRIWIDPQISWDKTPGEFLAHENSTLALIDLEIPAQIVGNFQIATRLYGTDSAGEAFNMKEKAFGKLGRLIREQHPQFLSCLLLLVCLLDTAGFPELTQELLYHTHNMAHIILGSTHHITRLTSWVVHSENRDALADRALEYIQDLYQERAGFLHPHHLEAAYNRAWGQFVRGQVYDARYNFRRLYNLFESYAKFDGLSARKVLYSMAQVEIALGSMEMADNLLAETQRQIVRRFGTGTHIEMGFECLRLRASLRRGSDSEMALMMSETLAVAEKFIGGNHPTVLLLKQSDRASCQL